MITLYGISNCNTVKKARHALENAGVDYHFHDYKKAGMGEAQLRAFVEAFGWEKVLNRAGMTWRNLPDAEKAAVTNANSAIALMREKTSIIKRPVLELADGELVLGYDEARYGEIAKRANAA